MTLPDIAGLIGAGMMMLAYAASALGKLSPTRAPALFANLIGAGLILYSLIYAPNLPALVMEGAWFLVALAGLIRLALKRRP